MFYNLKEFQQLLQINSKFGIDIDYINFGLINYNLLFDNILNDKIEKRILSWKSVLIFEFLSPFWFIQNPSITQDNKNELALAAIKSAIAIKTIDDADDDFSDNDYMNISLTDKCYLWWNTCTKYDLANNQFPEVFKKWRKFNLYFQKKGKNFSPEEITIYKNPFYIYIYNSYDSNKTILNEIIVYTYVIGFLDDLLDIFEDYYFNYPNSMLVKLNLTEIKSKKSLLQILIKERFIDTQINIICNYIKEILSQLKEKNYFFKEHLKHLLMKIESQNFSEFVYQTLLISSAEDNVV